MKLVATFEFGAFLLFFIIESGLMARSNSFGSRYEEIDAAFKRQLFSPTFTRPITMRHIADKVHSEGYDLELPCKAVGALPIKYSWKVNGRNLRRKYRFTIKNEATILRIKRIRATDSAVYTCVASNKYGNLTFSFPLTVRENLFGKSPAFYDMDIMKRQKFTVRPTGQSARFRCEAKGNSVMSYKWLKNGKPLVFRNRKHRKRMDVSNHSLKIRKLVLADAGNYTCIASNKYGSVAFSFFLNMLRTRKGGRPRVITYKQEPYTKAKVGQDVSLECLELTSATLPYVQWHAWRIPVEKRIALISIFKRKNSRKLVKKLYRHIDPKFYSTFTVDESYKKNAYSNNPWIFDETRPYGLRLILRNVTVADSGMYTCSASNYQGSDLAKLFLEVYT